MMQMGIGECIWWEDILGGGANVVLEKSLV